MKKLFLLLTIFTALQFTAEAQNTSQLDTVIINHKNMDTALFRFYLSTRPGKNNGHEFKGTIDSVFQQMRRALGWNVSGGGGTDTAIFTKNFLQITRNILGNTIGNDTSKVHSYQFYKGVFVNNGLTYQHISIGSPTNKYTSSNNLKYDTTVVPEVIVGTTSNFGDVLSTTHTLYASDGTGKRCLIAFNTDSTGGDLYISLPAKQPASNGKMLYGNADGSMWWGSIPTGAPDSTIIVAPFLTKSRSGTIITIGIDTSKVHSYAFYKGQFYPLTGNPSGFLSGVVSAANGGTGQNNSSATGIQIWISGTSSVSTALPNGTTATTQSLGDASTDVATDQFVNNAISGTRGDQNVKQVVLAASDVDINISTFTGAFNCDGVAIPVGPTTRLLLMGQTAPAENGIYDYDGTFWTRSSDANNSNSLTYAIVPVSKGTKYGATQWQQLTVIGTINVTAATFTQMFLPKVDGTSITGTGSAASPLVASGGSSNEVTVNLTSYANYTIPNTKNYTIIINASGTASKIFPPASPIEGQKVYVTNAASGEMSLHAADWGIPYDVTLYGSANTVTGVAPNNSISLIYQGGAWLIVSNNIPVEKETKIHLTSGNLSTLNSSPIIINDYPAVSGYVWKITSVVISYTFNSIPYSYTSFNVGAVGAVQQYVSATPDPSQSYIVSGMPNPAITSSSPDLLNNAAIQIQSDTDDFSGVDGSADIYITAKLIKL